MYGLLALCFLLTRMTNEVPSRSPLDDLLGKMENDLRLRRREIDSHLAPMELALAAYRRALEAQAATEYASSHHLPRPDLAALSPRIAAFNLMRTVEALREMPRTPQPSSSTTDDVAGAEERGAQLQQGVAHEHGAQALSSEGEDTGARSLADALPKVAAACDAKKLVIVGALAGRKRALPEPLDGATEWVDTSDGGAHATGNLPTRIRQGRVFGLIVCDQSIAHQHSEPLVSAARSARVPVGFAGKGGGAAIARALKAIEEQL